MKQKRERQTALLKLIRKRRLKSQEEIVRTLNSRGFSATQTSVSRDLRELGVVKAGGRYALPSEAGPADSTSVIDGHTNELIVSAEPIGANLVVVRTVIGAANTVAVGLDRLDSPDIVGTIAGDDTIFVAARSRISQGRIVTAVNQMVAAARTGGPPL